MKKHLLCLVALSGAAFLSPTASFADILFSDNFENGLGQWIGKGGGGYSAVTVADPLNSGHGQVVSFTALAGGGDIFSSTVLSPSGPFTISFDYLGLPGRGGTPGDLGGFLGISYNLYPLYPNVDHFWLFGTQDSFPGLAVPLIDDGAWHHYSLQLNGSSYSAFHVMAEDFADSGGVPGDVFFDNLVVATVPEPSVLTLVVLGGFLFVGRRRH